MKKITMFLTSLIVCSSSVLASLDGAKVISTKELVGVCTDQSSAQQQVYCDVYGQVSMTVILLLAIQKMHMNLFA